MFFGSREWSWPKTAAQPTDSDGNAMVWWGDHTLSTFFQSTALKNGREREFCKKVCMNSSSICAKQIHC